MYFIFIEIQVYLSIECLDWFMVKRTAQASGQHLTTCMLLDFS